MLPLQAWATEFKSPGTHVNGRWVWWPSVIPEQAKEKDWPHQRTLDSV